MSRQELELVLQAGRYTATAKNAQGCRFIVVQDGLAELKRLVWDGIGDLLALPAEEKPRWAKLYKPFLRDAQAGKRGLPVPRRPPAGGARWPPSAPAPTRAWRRGTTELMAASLGLGVLFNGYLCRASEELPAVRAFLGADERPLQMCLLLGCPAVSYPRTAPRMPGDFVVK